MKQQRSKSSFVSSGFVERIGRWFKGSGGFRNLPEICQKFVRNLSSFYSLAANGAQIHFHLNTQTPDSLLCTASRRRCHLDVRSVRCNGEARRRVVSVGETLAAFRECGGLPQTEGRFGQALSCCAAQALPRSFQLPALTQALAQRGNAPKTSR